MSTTIKGILINFYYFVYYSLFLCHIKDFQKLSTGGFKTHYRLIFVETAKYVIEFCRNLHQYTLYQCLGNTLHADKHLIEGYNFK